MSNKRDREQYGRQRGLSYDAWGKQAIEWRNVGRLIDPPKVVNVEGKRSLYFAYGSNMDRGQMKRRCPESRFSGVGRLIGWQLAFAGDNRSWGGAIATLVESNKAETEGVIYSLTDADLIRLDMYEGWPFTYAVKLVTVLDGLNRPVKCRTYLLRDARKTGAPGPKYIAQVQQAYMDYGFDLKRLYRAAMEAVR